MKTEFTRFGDPAKFEVAVRWQEDSEPRERRPAEHGWSMGDLQITVCGQVLTRSQRGKASQPYVSWYLSPFFDWLASKWLRLMHEEAPSWPARSLSPIAADCRQALLEFIVATDKAGRENYAATRAWYVSHGLRSAAAGGLFPDIFIRRLADDIEISWLSTTPPFAGEDFSFQTRPGAASFAVEEVATPLWSLLDWFITQPPQLDGVDRRSWAKACRKIRALKKSKLVHMEDAFLSPTVRERLAKLPKMEDKNKLFTSKKIAKVPALHTFAPAVAMFGGVNPNLGQKDIERLLVVLREQCGGSDAPKLKEIVTRNGAALRGIPYKSGYAFAADLLTKLDLDETADSPVNIRAIVAELGIAIDEKKMATSTIRGVAIAGEGFSPKIVINLTSPFNASEEGRRFTLAHELCHILHDRSRARRVTHISGAWVELGVEKRANAFAAYFLMPRNRVVAAIGKQKPSDLDVVRKVANRLQVSESALVEHLYNLRIIDDSDREHLKHHG